MAARSNDPSSTPFTPPLVPVPVSKFKRTEGTSASSVGWMVSKTDITVPEPETLREVGGCGEGDAVIPLHPISNNPINIIKNTLPTTERGVNQVMVAPNSDG